MLDITTASNRDMAFGNTKVLFPYFHEYLIFRSPEQQQEEGRMDALLPAFPSMNMNTMYTHGDVPLPHVGTEHASLQVHAYPYTAHSPLWQMTDEHEPPYGEHSPPPTAEGWFH